MGRSLPLRRPRAHTAVRLLLASALVLPVTLAVGVVAGDAQTTSTTCTVDLLGQCVTAPTPLPTVAVPTLAVPSLAVPTVTALPALPLASPTALPAGGTSGGICLVSCTVGSAGSQQCTLSVSGTCVVNGSPSSGPGGGGSGGLPCVTNCSSGQQTCTVDVVTGVCILPTGSGPTPSNCTVGVPGQCLVSGAPGSPSPGGQPASGRGGGSTVSSTSSSAALGLGGAGAGSSGGGDGSTTGGSLPAAVLDTRPVGAVDPLGPLSGISFGGALVVLPVFLVLDVLALLALVLVVRRSWSATPAD